MTIGRQNEVTRIMHDHIKSLHSSMESMPQETDEESQPLGLKSSVTLFPHQRQVRKPELGSSGVKNQAVQGWDLQALKLGQNKGYRFFH